MKNIPTLKMTIEDLKTDGVSRISLVSDPAIEKNFVCLSKRKIAFKEIDKKRQILMGVILAPDQLILREESGKKYNIMFSKDTVLEIAELYLQKGFQKEVNLEHSTPVKGSCIVQSWVVESVKKDKSALYKLGAKVGDWIGLMKIENKKLYRAALNGDIKGFSIEGLFADDTEQDLSDAKTVKKMGELLKSYL